MQPQAGPQAGPQGVFGPDRTPDGHLFTKALLVSTDEGILQFPHNLADLPGTADSKPDVLVRGGKTVAMDFNYNEKAIYYTKEMDDGTQSIQKYDMTTNSSLTICTGGQGIEGLAVDWVASNIYWTEKDNGAINVARLDGSSRKVLLSDLDQPSGIAVQPEQKSLYWTENGRISRSTLAGTLKEVIVSSQSDVSVGNPTGIAVDPLNSRIYWTQSNTGTVMSSNLRGNDVQLYWTSNGRELFGMAVYKDFQFWTDRINRTVSIGLRSTLEKTVQLQTTPHSVRVFDGSEQPPSRGACDQRNGGCAELCIPLGDSRVCACGEGRYIQADEVSCSYIRPTNIPITTPQTTTPQTDPYSREDFLLVADYDAGYIVEVNITSGSKVTLPLQSTTPTALDYDAETDYVYWSDYYDEMIYRAKRDGSGKEVLIDNNVISVYSIHGLALDYAGQNIYWTDSWTEIIGVARMDGSHARAIVSEDLDYPGGIALDPSEGYMYWTDEGFWDPARIERAAMDGSERTVIIDSDLDSPTGIAIDLNERRLYWCDSGNYIIESSDLDGSNRRTVVSLYSNFYGISLHSHDLFWTSTSDDYIGANTKSDSDQTTSRVLAEEFSSPRGIAIYSPGIVANVSNACSVSNGGCQDMCLARPGGRTCACRAYFSLHNDNATCVPPEIKSPSYLWIAEDDGETLLTMLEGNSSIIRDAQSAPRTRVMSASSPSIIVSFDYDIRQGRIFWIDIGMKEIQQVDIQTGEVTTLKTGISAGAEFLAADWVNQNLYYTDFNYNRITMVSYSSGDSNGNSHIITETGLDKPRGIAVDPSAALLFWSDWGQLPKIERSTLSGEDRTVIVDSDLGHPSGLVIDYVNSKLYFADTELDAIYSCDFDGGNRQQFYTLGRTHFYDITFDGEEIMASDWSDGSINFIHDTRPIAFFSGGGKVLAVEFFDESRQLQSQSDCQVNNGGCQHTCVGDVSGHRCLCLPDYSLAEDQHACVKNDHLFTKALLVSTDEGILQFPHNLVDLPATADSKPAVLVRGGRTVAMDFNYNEKAVYYTKEMGDGTQSIQKYELTTNTSMTIYTGGQGIEGLAVDWVASNIYWTERNNGTINVARLDGSFRKVLLSGLLQPRGVAVHPEQKVLYWTETGRISRSTLAGTNKSVVVSSQSDVSISNPTGIAIDLPNSWVYWTDGGTAMSSNLRGEDAEPYWSSNGGELFGIAVYKDFQLWTDRTNRNVRVGLRGTLEKTVQLQTTPHSVRVFDGSEQPLSRGPCDLRNGGCNELCLPITADDRVCACAEGHMMQADNLTCFNPAPTAPPTTAVQTTTVTPSQPATTQAAPRTTYEQVTACSTDTLPSVTNGEFGQCVVITGVKTCPVVCRPTYGPTVSNIKCLPNGNWNTSTGFTCTKLTTPQAISVPVSFSIPTAPCTSDTSALASVRSSLIRNFQNNGICRTASQNNVELCNPNQMTVSCSVVSGRKKRAPKTEGQTEENHNLKKRNIISYLSHEKTLKKQAKEEMAMFRDANRKKRNPILHIKSKQANNDDVLLQVVKKAVADGAILVNRVKRNGNGLNVDIEVKATPDTSDGNVEDNISKAQAKVQDVVDEIRTEVTSGNVAVEMDGRTYTADPRSFTAMAVKYDCPVGTIQIDGGCGEAPSSGGSNGTAVAVGVIVALLLLGAISLGGYMYCRQQRRKFGPGQNVRLSDLTARDNPVYDASDIPPAYTEYTGESYNAYAMAGLPEKAGPDGAMQAGALPEKAPTPQWVTFDDGSNTFREPAEQNVYETVPPSAPPVEYNMFVDNPSNEKGGETHA